MNDPMTPQEARDIAARVRQLHRLMADPAADRGPASGPAKPSG